MTTAVKPVPLRRQEDRCDKCRAEAFMLAQKADSVLLFCGHHGREYRTNLEFDGWEVLDFTDEIG